MKCQRRNTQATRSVTRSPPQSPSTTHLSTAMPSGRRKNLPAQETDEATEIQSKRTTRSVTKDAAVSSENAGKCTLYSLNHICLFGILPQLHRVLRRRSLTPVKVCTMLDVSPVADACISGDGKTKGGRQENKYNSHISYRGTSAHGFDRSSKGTALEVKESGRTRNKKTAR